jgi:hypothetical protein
MFSWGTKRDTKEPTLAEKLSSSTKKTRADLSAKIAQITNSAKNLSLNTLSNHSTSETTPVCSLNFSDSKFCIKIDGFLSLKMEEQNDIVNSVAEYLKENKLDVFQTGNILTVTWPDDQTTQKVDLPKDVLVKSEDVVPGNQ